ncbi:MAG: hypothetical protein V2I33_18445 [Kangiellaceae bacterium]|jgi:hypothetical protein|nr:hypothetical protein [Kangiellaceae bacterium]
MTTFAMILLPVIGNVLFMPIIGIMLSVFICYETSGEDVNDAFLAKDCYETCWQGEHLMYVVFAAFCLLLYVPLSVYMRPMWQQLQLDLNVVTHPFFIMTKTVF